MINRLDFLSFVTLQVVVFLAPIFFVPSIAASVQLGKAAFIIYGVLVALALWSVARLKDGVFEAPKSLFYASGGVLLAVYALSALLSDNRLASLSGQSFELGTLAFFAVSMIMFALVPLVVKTREQVFLSHAAVIGSFLLIALFHVVRFVLGPDALDLGLFTTATSNLIGKWNDVGVFFGLVAVISFIALERARLSGLLKALVIACFVGSLLLAAIVNFTSVWIALAVLSIVFFVYELSFGKREEVGGHDGQNDQVDASVRARVPLYALAVLIISVSFIFGGARIGSVVSNALGISNIEVRPSWEATVDVSKQSLAQDPFFGAGPNRFSSAWLAHKPVGINDTIFWNTDFNYGIGFIPSLAVTTGLAGLLAALLFAGLFLWTAFRALTRASASPFSRYLALSSLFAALYLWIFCFAYVPSAALWILTLFFSGLFIASMRHDGSIGWISYPVLTKPAANFISVLLIIFVLIGSVSLGYFVAVKTAANVFFQKGAAVIRVDGDLDKGESYVARAFDLAPSDLYARAMSEIYLVRINNLLARNDIGAEEARQIFQGYLSGAIQAGNSAIAVDDTDYTNYLALGRVFEAVVPLGIEGSYENAKTSYQSALALNPDSPEVYFMLARLEAAQGDAKAAKGYIEQSLEKKSDYAASVYLLAQLQVAEGNVPEAIRSVESVALLSPTDPGIFFQLGLLYYNQKRYQDATLSFGRAVALNPQYANAKYFLGLSYYETGDKAASLAQFKDLATSNPNNQDVKAIISNLEAGKAPLGGRGVTPEELPVPEQGEGDN